MLGIALSSNISYTAMQMLGIEMGAMNTIFHVMKEEYDRLMEADRTYRKNIEKLPSGSPRIKHIRKHDYLYLARRDGPRVVYDYIGRADSEKAKRTLDQVERRKRYESLLRDIRKTLKDVKKALRGKI